MGRKLDRKGTLSCVSLSPGEYIVCGVLVSPLLCHYPINVTLNVKRFPYATSMKRKHFLRRRRCI